MIVEKLNESSDKLFEQDGYEEGDQRFAYPEEAGFEIIEDEEDDAVEAEYDEDGNLIVADEDEVIGDEDGENCRVVCDDDEDMGDDQGSLEETPMDDVDTDEEEGEMTYSEEEEEEMAMAMESNDNDNEDSDETTIVENAEETENNETEVVNLDEKIDKLIEEAKKRKASETNEHHFLKFLNKSQVDSFYNLENDEQEKVVAHINERGNYMSDGDVLKLMQEALSLKAETLEEKLIRLMPDSIKENWEQMDESAKVSILSQAKLYPELTTEQQIEHFWLTRNIKARTSSKTFNR